MKIGLWGCYLLLGEYEDEFYDVLLFYFDFFVTLNQFTHKKTAGMRRWMNAVATGGRKLRRS